MMMIMMMMIIVIMILIITTTLMMIALKGTIPAFYNLLTTPRTVSNTYSRWSGSKS